MKTDANWTARIGVMLGLCAALAVASCGGGGGNANLSNGSVSEAPGASGASGSITVSGTDDIAGLPQAQQRLLTDPGWNQPYIEPLAGVTGLPAPSHAELLELTRARLAQDELIMPRGVVATEPGNRAASFVGQGSAAYNNISPPYGGANNVPDDNGVDIIGKAEYRQFALAADPSYGCNADGTNQGGRTPPNAIEDTIIFYNTSGMPNIPICYVLEGITTANYFNTGGGNGGNARSAVYQLFSTVRSALAKDWESLKTTEFAEVAYRSDLTQYGAAPGQGLQPNGNPGGDLCYLGATTIAHGVKGHFWKTFNRSNNALPNGASTLNYNILIAPANEAQGVGSASTDFRSVDNSQLEWQAFYFGSVHECYGGAMIIGLSSTTSSCQAFADIFDQAAGFFYNPIYGVVLAKWEQMAPASDPSRPWKGQLGAVVFGPVAYRNGAATTEANRKWYAWGWYFERGFMWYVDNDQTAFLNTPDEAQVYLYDGANTYCAGGEYTQVLPSTMFLGPNANIFRVNVDVTGYSLDGTTFTAPSFDTASGQYQIPMVDNAGQHEVTVAVAASAYGGSPGPDCEYASYIFSWRDGTITLAGTDNTQTHLYQGAAPGGLPSTNKASVYVVRVQAQDSASAITYGDSIPFELGVAGGGGGGGGSDVLVVRNDGAGFAANYNAIISDLNAIKAANPAFTFTEVNYGGANAGAAWVNTVKGNFKIVIWYRGAAPPGGATQTTSYTAGEVADINGIMANPDGRALLHFSQGLSPASNGFFVGFEFGGLLPVTTSLADFTTMTGLSGTSAAHGSYTGYIEPGFTGWLLPVAIPALGEACAATAPGSGNRLTGAANLAANQQVTFHTSLPGAVIGSQHSLGCISSYGNTAAGKRHFTIGYSWSNLTPTAGTPATPTRAQVLRNILAGLDGTIMAGGGGGGGDGFNQYTDVAQVLAVTPIQYQGDGNVLLGNSSETGTTYPDLLDATGYSTDVLVNTATDDEVVTSVAGNDGTNANDLAYQAPFYAYIEDSDGNMGTLGDTAPNGDESVTFGGLLLENNGDWTRVDPASAGYENFKTHFPGAPFNGVLPASGYYVSTSGDFTNTRRAFYGANIPHLTFDNADGPVSYEAIAHWAPDLEYFGGTPATVQWSVWPGDGVVDLNNVPAARYGSTSSSDNYWAEIDVDPSVDPEWTGRDGGNSPLYNASDFGRSGAQAGGRILTFSYGAMAGHDGDLNRNGVRGEAEDKFPVRARVYGDYDSYILYLGNNWPDNVPDLASFSEGGCYVADAGERVTGIQVTNDANPANDPHLTVSYVSGATWQVNLFFQVAQSQSPFTVDFNPDYPNPASIVSVTGSTTPNVTSDGVKAILNRQITISPYTGPTTRVLAVRVTDSSGPSNWFFWPDPVSFNTPPVLTDDFEAPLDTVTKWFPPTMLNAAVWNRRTASYGFYTVFVTAASPTPPTPPHTGPYYQSQFIPANGATTGYLGIEMPGFWTVMNPSNLNANAVIRSRSVPVIPGKTYDVSFKTHGNAGPNTPLCVGYSFDGGTTWNFPATATPTNPTPMVLTAGTVPAPLTSQNVTGWNPTIALFNNGVNGTIVGYTAPAPVGFAGIVNINFGAAFNNTQAFPFFGWYQRSFTTIPAPAGAPQMQVIFLLYHFAGTTQYNPGPVVDDLIVQ